MRTGTKNFMTGISLGLIGMSYAIGAAANSNSGTPSLAAGGTSTPTATATPTPTSSPKPSATATKKASTAKKKTSTSTKKTSSSSTSTKKTSSSSTTKKTTTTKKTSSTSATKTGSTVSYKFGEVQLKVTKKSGKITDISGTLTYTRGPGDLGSQLVDKAISANGSDFSNISRVTYTTKAFKQALDSALSKF